MCSKFKASVGSGLGHLSDCFQTTFGRRRIGQKQQNKTNGNRIEPVLSTAVWRCPHQPFSVGCTRNKCIWWIQRSAWMQFIDFTFMNWKSISGFREQNCFHLFFSSLKSWFCFPLALDSERWGLRICNWWTSTNSTESGEWLRMSWSQWSWK